MADITLWLPESNTVTHQALGKAAEECGELAQILVRCLIQGVNGRDPKTGQLNRDRLAEELADFDAAISWLFELLMALAPQHTFQVLTKRPERMRDYLLTLPQRAPAVAKWAAWHWGGKDPDAVWAAASQTCRAPLPNVWLGVSIEDQKRADERIPILLETPAAVRWISAEPLLGPVDIGRWTASANVKCKICETSFWLHKADPCRHAEQGGWTLACPRCGGCRCKPGGTEMDARCATPVEPPQDWVDRKVGRFNKVHPTITLTSMIDWVVAGGESGHNARPMHPDWARSLRHQCAAAGVPFLFKQWGEYLPCPWKLERLHDETDEAYKARSESECSRLAVSKQGFIHELSQAPWSCERVLPQPETHQAIRKVGKHVTGRLLDGIEHNAFPTPLPREEARCPAI